MKPRITRMTQIKKGLLRNCERIGICSTRYMDRRSKALGRGTRIVAAMGEATPGPLRGACEAVGTEGGTLSLKVRPGAEMWLANVEKREMAEKLGVKNIKLCV